MTRQSGFTLLLMLAFLAASSTSVLAHPYPAPHTHKLTKSDSPTGDAHKKSSEGVQPTSQQKPKSKPVPKNGPAKEKQKRPAKPKSTTRIQVPSSI